MPAKITSPATASAPLVLARNLSDPELYDFLEAQTTGEAVVITDKAGRIAGAISRRRRGDLLCRIRRGI